MKQLQEGREKAQTNLTALVENRRKQLSKYIIDKLKLSETTVIPDWQDVSRALELEPTFVSKLLNGKLPKTPTVFLEQFIKFYPEVDPNKLFKDAVTEGRGNELEIESELRVAMLLHATLNLQPETESPAADLASRIYSNMLGKGVAVWDAKLLEKISNVALSFETLCQDQGIEVKPEFLQVLDKKYRELPTNNIFSTIDEIIELALEQDEDVYNELIKLPLQVIKDNINTYNKVAAINPNESILMDEFVTDNYKITPKNRRGDIEKASCKFKQIPNVGFSILNVPKGVKICHNRKHWFEFCFLISGECEFLMGDRKPIRMNTDGKRMLIHLAEEEHSIRAITDCECLCLTYNYGQIKKPRLDAIIERSGIRP